MPKPSAPLPRQLADLSYAAYLEPFQGRRLEPDAAYDSVHLDGGAFEGDEAGGARFIEAALSGVSLTSVGLRQARLNDVWLQGVRLVGCDAAESSWLDAEVGQSVLAGLELWGAGLRRVVFHHCKFDSVNLRGAKLTEVWFVDCVLKEVDFGGAALQQVSFPGSTLDAVHLDQARLRDVDLRQAVRIDLASGVEALRGSTITGHQLLDLAPAFAQALGVRVADA
ncbi:pentapeptide repeat-containing protein [Streptacidiphilus monticola]|jgi:uncharacterized protein YjbI with pentapeptide repeats|uniref:Pentapeptide repeat-containing protein n=1 Tax=Streptacidiphilus monticola TaxID=2161674 RepID=A0ABW1G8U5_9ACTN